LSSGLDWFEQKPKYLESWENLLGNGFPALCIFPLDTNAIVDAEARVTSPHEFSDQFVWNRSLLFQTFENFCPKQILKRRIRAFEPGPGQERFRLSRSGNDIGSWLPMSP